MGGRSGCAPGDGGWDTAGDGDGDTAGDDGGWYATAIREGRVARRGVRYRVARYNRPRVFTEPNGKRGVVWSDVQHRASRVERAFRGTHWLFG